MGGFLLAFLLKSLLVTFSPDQTEGRDERVFNLAVDSPVTSNQASFLLPYYGIEFRQDVEGLRTLDVCSGGSDLTAALLSMGADAHALDIGYGDFLTFKRMLRDFGPLNTNFHSSFWENRDRYHAHSVTQIPFPDGSIDRVFSFFGVFGVLDKDEELLKLSLAEILRVLPRGGIAQIGPFQYDSPDFSEEDLETQLEAAGWLMKQKGVRVVISEDLFPDPPIKDYIGARKLVVERL